MAVYGPSQGTCEIPSRSIGYVLRSPTATCWSSNILLQTHVFSVGLFYAASAFLSRILNKAKPRESSKPTQDPRTKPDGRRDRGDGHEGEAARTAAFFVHIPYAVQALSIWRESASDVLWVAPRPLPGHLCPVSCPGCRWRGWRDKPCRVPGARGRWRRVYYCSILPTDQPATIATQTNGTNSTLL